MKLALLLPGYLESPNYHHLVVIDEKLKTLGYTTVRVDACRVWETGDSQNYTMTNYLRQVEEIIKSYESQNPTEIILVGHSQGSFIALLEANNNPKLSKVVGISLPNPHGQSASKWINGLRVSQKDLPEDPTKFREFSVPVSYVHDRDKYSLLSALKKNQKPLLIIMGADDPTTPEVEKMAPTLSSASFLKIPNMGHDFRDSEELCQQVAGEIEKFLKTN